MTAPHTELTAARTIWRVPINRIDAEGGARPLDPAWVEGLAGLMAQHGQEDPIELVALPNGRYRVIAGRHRNAAAIRLGWTHIDGDLKTAGARRREYSENLFRSGLKPLDRASFVAGLIETMRAEAGVAPDASPQSVAIQARWQKSLQKEATDTGLMMSHVFGWSEKVAEVVGLSRATITRDLTIHRGIPADLARRVRATPAGENAGQMLALAKMEARLQDAIVRKLEAREAVTVSEASAIVQARPKPDMVRKGFDAVIGNFARLPDAQKKAVLRELALPRGVTLIIDGDEVGQ